MSRISDEQERAADVITAQNGKEVRANVRAFGAMTQWQMRSSRSGH